jgi:Mg-chelatase subunit ChlD
MDGVTMRAWLQRHRIAVGYVLLATGFGALALWFVASLGVLAAFLRGQGLELQEPSYLWLLATVPFFWFVRLHSLTDMPLGQQWLSALLRSLMTAALVVALCRPTYIHHENQQVTTVLVVDVSASVSDVSLANASQQLQTMWNARGEARLRLVTFDETARVVPLYSDEEGRLSPIQRHSGGGLGTDLQQAVRLAYGLYPPGHFKRMVLVTDGNETAGNVVSEVETAVRLGVRVYYQSGPEQPPRPELMVTGLDVPTDIEPNVPFSVSVELTSNYAASASCVLRLDEREVGTAELASSVGDQVLDFEEVRVRDGGEHTFNVTCAPGGEADQSGTDPARDQVASNNVFTQTRFVQQKPRLLYVDGEALYSRNLRDALQDDFRVEVRGAQGVPNSLAGMREYAGIIISDVPRHNAYGRENLNSRQMHLLHDYARGGGLLLFTGGQDGLGPGGYSGTYLERRVLPVRLDVEHEMETPRLALVLLMDNSGSMRGRKLELAKKAARETVAALDRQDRVGIIAFDSEPQSLIRLTRVANRSRFDRALARLNAGGGTAIHPALSEAFQALEGVEAQLKHVILMTDGQSNRQGILWTVEEAARQRITVSTIAVGAGSDRGLLAEIARVGNGRHYYTESVEAIPRLFVDETREIAGQTVIDEPVRPVVVRRHANLPFFRGLNMRSAPRLGGYVPTQAKRQAQVVMQTSSGDPLLVRWRRGEGWVYVFTSDLKNKWGRRWLRWPSFAPFWRQLIKDGLHEEEQETEYPIQVSAARHLLTITTDAIGEDERFVSGLSSRAVVTGPTGESAEVRLQQTAPGRYQAQIPATEYGPYQVDVVHERNGERVAVSHGRATYPYAEEYVRFSPDLTRVANVSALTGGQIDPALDRLFAATGEQKTHRKPAWAFLLAAVLAAFMLDVFLRRVRLWRAGTLAWGRRAG